jgi:exopolyphosphatase/guanosine-5'-triphosphate,3'-diphosphate pyrophosphatase
MDHFAPQRRAVIDVGTNSVKLLVADVAGSAITPILEESNQTRLGAGFYTTRQLAASAIAKTSAAVAYYSDRAKKLGAASIRLIGTSAARDAVNRNDLTSAIRMECGLPMQVLSGTEEADWAYRGVASNPALARQPVLVLDVGGGSTEFIVGEKGASEFCHSYPLGSVRLLEQLQPADPPGLEDLTRCRENLQAFLNQNVAPELGPVLHRCKGFPELVGTSGTASILARMEARTDTFDRGMIEATTLSLSRISGLLETLWQLPLAERRKIPGLPPDRADVIATGIAIYEAIMTRFGFRNLRISTRGLRYWALLQPLAQEVAPATF